MSRRGDVNQDMHGSKRKVGEAVDASRYVCACGVSWTSVFQTIRRGALTDPGPDDLLKLPILHVVLPMLARNVLALGHWIFF